MSGFRRIHLFDCNNSRNQSMFGGSDMKKRIRSYYQRILSFLMTVVLVLSSMPIRQSVRAETVPTTGVGVFNNALRPSNSRTMNKYRLTFNHYDSEDFDPQTGTMGKSKLVGDTEIHISGSGVGKDMYLTPVASGAYKGTYEFELEPGEWVDFSKSEAFRKFLLDNGVTNLTIEMLDYTGSGTSQSQNWIVCQNQRSTFDGSTSSSEGFVRPVTHQTTITDENEQEQTVYVLDGFEFCHTDSNDAPVFNEAIRNVESIILTSYTVTVDWLDNLPQSQRDALGVSVNLHLTQDGGEIQNLWRQTKTYVQDEETRTYYYYYYAENKRNEDDTAVTVYDFPGLYVESNNLYKYSFMVPYYDASSFDGAGMAVPSEAQRVEHQYDVTASLNSTRDYRIEEADPDDPHHRIYDPNHNAVYYNIHKTSFSANLAFRDAAEPDANLAFRDAAEPDARPALIDAFMDNFTLMCEDSNTPILGSYTGSTAPDSTAYRFVSSTDEDQAYSVTFKLTGTNTYTAVIDDGLGETADGHHVYEKEFTVPEGTSDVAAFDGFTTTFLLIMPKKEQIVKTYQRSIVFNADAQNRSYFIDTDSASADTEGNTVHTERFELTFTVEVNGASRTVSYVRHNGRTITAAQINALLSGNSLTGDLVPADASGTDWLRVIEGYASTESVQNTWTTDGTDSFIDLDYTILSNIVTDSSIDAAHYTADAPVREYTAVLTP